MAKALECPACGARHSLDTVPDARTFRCDRCGQVLKVPEGIDSSRAAPRSGAAAPAAPAAPSGGAPPPPPRRGGSAATGPTVSATASATVPAAFAATTDPSRETNGAGRRAPAAPRKRVHWYWRMLAWIAAVPLGLAITGWPALQLDLINKDDLLDVFVGEGSGRYVRLLVFAAAWALVTALLVQLFVEGGRWWSRRRRAKAGTRTPVPV